MALQCSRWTGNRNITVTMSAIIYSLGMIILNVSVLAYVVLTSGESIIYSETLCPALSAYFTCLLWFRQTAWQIERFKELIGKTYYCVWLKVLQLLLTTQVLFVIMWVTAGMPEISQEIRELYEFQTVLLCMLYCVSKLAGFTFLPIEFTWGSRPCAVIKRYRNFEGSLWLLLQSKAIQIKITFLCLFITPKDSYSRIMESRRSDE
jgi:hypothetical protein